MSEPRMTLHAKMLGHGADGEQASVVLEGLLMAQAALVLARLGVPGLIAGGPRPVADLAAEAGADADALDRVLAAAAVYGLVRRDDAGLYVLTGAGELFRTDVGGSARYLAAGWLAPPMWMVGSHLVDVVATGKVNPGAPGGLYEYYGKHPEEAVLGNCRKAGRPGNSIMVIELMLPDGPEPSLAHIMDLIMLTTLGGRERTRAQHEELMAEEGYRLVRDTPLARVLPWRILEFQHG